MEQSKAFPAGPLTGVRVVEIAGIGPGPFACMMLADMGADVVTVDRPGRKVPDASNPAGRGRTWMTADLKDAAQREGVFQLLERADILVEGFRPGVMERLELGPDDVAARNQRLVYGRMTGWGQLGPLAQAAGHDLNYIAISGALHAIGPQGGPPVPPINLLGDYGGGSLYLLVGLLAALHEAQRSGRGQVVDAAIVDGVVSLMSNVVAHEARGIFCEERGSNLLDGGAPFYAVYGTADGQYISIAAIEPQFFAELCRLVGLAPAWQRLQNDRTQWPQLRTELERIFASRSRDEWTALLEGTDVCYAPVLSLSEARQHRHNVARGTFRATGGLSLPAPAPRFSRTPSSLRDPAQTESTSLEALLARWDTPRLGASLV